MLGNIGEHNMSRTYRHRKLEHRAGAFCRTHNWVLRELVTETELQQIDPLDLSNVIHYGCRYRYVYDEHGNFAKIARGENLYEVMYSPKSTEGKRRLAKWHSDGGTTSFKEPGPSWFKNLFTTRPNRRTAKREIHKWIRNEEYEVQLHPIGKRVYWT